VSGGHWDYLSPKLRERAEYAGEIWRLLAEIEHDLDWGISCDTCYECAKMRVIRALEAFFDTGATSIETSVRLMASSEPECQKCRDRLYQSEPRSVLARGSVTIEFEYEGKRYKGTMYEVSQ
jgi:hypothetical protein